MTAGWEHHQATECRSSILWPEDRTQAKWPQTHQALFLSRPVHAHWCGGKGRGGSKKKEEAAQPLSEHWELYCQSDLTDLLLIHQSEEVFFIVWQSQLINVTSNHASVRIAPFLSLCADTSTGHKHVGGHTPERDSHPGTVPFQRLWQKNPAGPPQSSYPLHQVTVWKQTSPQKGKTGVGSGDLHGNICLFFKLFF